MENKLSFQDLQDIRQALQEFGQARTQAKPNRDVILAVNKIDGRETLKTIRISKMKWYSRFVRWLGFGNATLRSAARFLQEKEPYLPHVFSGLKKEDYFLKNHYEPDALNYLTDVNQMTKDNYRELQRIKSKGCDVLKRCVSHYNKKHRSKIAIEFVESEKINLLNSFKRSTRCIHHTSPNPMTPFPKDENIHLRNLYKVPFVDEQGAYKDRARRVRDKIEVSSAVIGFCFEHGLGTKKNKAAAIRNYEEVIQTEYSACYNLGHLYFKDEDYVRSIEALKKAEEILLGKIHFAQNKVNEVRNQRWPDDYAEQLLMEVENLPDNREEQAEGRERRQKYIEGLEKENAHYFKKWNKALYQTYLVLIEVYKKTGDVALSAEYQQKAEAIQLV